MKNFILLLMAVFFTVGTSLAQENSGDAFALVSAYPDSKSPVFSVNYIQLNFNKDVEVTLPEGGIEVKNNESGEVIKITRINRDEYMSKNMVLFLFEQKVVEGKEGKEEYVEQFIEAPGTYSYTVPAGCIKSVDGEEFGEQTFTFTVASVLNIEKVTPDYNGTVKLERVEITFDKEIAEVNIPTSGLYIVDNYWSPVAEIKKDPIISEDKKTVTLELDSPITTPGVYNLDIYQGTFVATDNSVNQYSSFTFHVIDTAPSYSTNLKDGEKVKEIKNLEITFKNVNEVKLVEGAAKVIAYMPGGGESEGTATLADKKITVTFDQELTEEGDYMILIPAGMFTMDDVENEERLLEITLYTLDITPLKIVSVTPVEGNVNQLDKIIIEFNQAVTLSFNENWQQISYEIMLQNGDKGYTLTYNSMSNVSNKVEYLVNAEWTGHEYASTPITEEGTYTLDLSQIVVDYAAEDGIDEYGYPATIWHEKGKACEGKATWTIVNDGTGIGEVTTENGKAKVIFDLTGRKVETATAPGIYIVNGKKVLVK